MKVLHVNSYYIGSGFYKNLYREQVKTGLDIDVYVPTSKDKDISSLNLGEYTYISKNHGKYDRIIFGLKHSKIYKDIVEKYNIGEYDLVHAHSLFSNGYIAYKLNKDYGIPYVVAVRNTDINTFFKYMVHLRSLGVKILKNAKSVIFISDLYKKKILKEYVSGKLKDEIVEKSVIVPNGVDDFWLDNKYCGRQFDNNNKNIKILYVGVINKNKNIEATIEACKRLIEEGYNIEYTIIGRLVDDNYKSIIENNSFISYIGHTDKENLLKYYRESDIFVMPSKHETFGLVYLEAMSQGLPLIYTRGQGFDGRFKEGEVGFSVKYDDSEEIASNIRKIIGNYNEISKRCLEKVEDFNWESIAEKYREIY